MEHSKIEWTDATVNFWHGCKKVSSGCKFCYMYRDKEQNYGGDPTKVLRTKDATFYKALEWKEPKKVFTCSWSDFFIDEADEWRKDAWDVIRQTPQHSWQILTKRPERIMQCLPADWGDGWGHVWLGVSIESQEHFDRAVMLSQIPAKTRFFSVEPLLDELHLLQLHNGKQVMDAFHWCIIGGESGYTGGKYHYRECKVEWMEKIVNDLKGTNVKVFVKQLGSFLAKKYNTWHPHGADEKMTKWPYKLRIREYPDNLFAPAQSVEV